MTYFFTLLDDSLRPKGSRDPLGLEMLWSQVGRRLVGNLTTVSHHLDNFILALIGFSYADTASDSEAAWRRFERFEQITARGRALAHLPGILGALRTAGTAELDLIPLGHAAQAAILQDARRSGLWGLYASPLAVTGLCTYERRLTSDGKAIAHDFLALLPAKHRGWLDGAIDKSHISRQELEAFKSCLPALLGASQPRDQLVAALLGGGGTAPKWQTVLYREAQTYLRDSDSASPAGLFRHLAQQNGDAELKGYAGRVIQLEAVLMLARIVFGYMLGCHGKSMAVLIQELGNGLRHWPDREQLTVPSFPEIRSPAWTQRADRFVKLAAAVRGEQWDTAVGILLDHHGSVMKERGGPPWAFNEGDRLKVVSGGASDHLPSAAELKAKFAEAWDNSYFLGSFLAILSQAQPRPEIQA